MSTLDSIKEKTEKGRSVEDGEWEKNYDEIVIMTGENKKLEEKANVLDEIIRYYKDKMEARKILDFGGVRECEDLIWRLIAKECGDVEGECVIKERRKRRKKRCD